MRSLLRPFVLVLLILLARVEVRAQSSPDSVPPPATPAPDSPPATPHHAKKVWTNDNIGGYSGPGSRSASGSSYASRHDFRSSSSDGVSITRPSAGEVVAPGTTLHIEVSADSDGNISNMAIVSPLGIGDEVRTSPPWSFTLNVPRDARASGDLIGPEPISVAFRRCGKNPDMNSTCLQDMFPTASTVVDVEDPTPATKLSALFPSISFDGVDLTQSNMQIFADFADGLQLDVTSSTRISFSSTNPAVADVDENGIVKQVGPGNAQIEVTYVGGGATTKLSIPVASWYPQKSER